MELKEAIEILKKQKDKREEIVKEAEETYRPITHIYDPLELSNKLLVEIIAIDTVLQALEEYQKQMDLDYVDENYISKDKIKEKIEKIKNEEVEDRFMFITATQGKLATIITLEELLKGE